MLLLCYNKKLDCVLKGLDSVIFSGQPSQTKWVDISPYMQIHQKPFTHLHLEHTYQDNNPPVIVKSKNRKKVLIWD